MTLTFLGTRGEISARTARHRRHTSTRVSSAGCSVVIDRGADWLGAAWRDAPDAILVTHAHPDHAGGLRAGAPCPVYAPEDVWRAIARWPIRERLVIPPRTPFRIGELSLSLGERRTRQGRRSSP